MEGTRDRWLVPGAVALLAAVVYANTLANGLVFDDRFLIEESPVVRAAAGPLDWLVSPYHAGTDLAGSGLYRPLALASLAVDHLWSGSDPLGYHLVNLLLHALCSALVLRLGLRVGLDRGVATAGALLFAVHPVHTEAVASISGRAELLAATFFLAGLLAHSRTLEPAAGGARRWSWAAAGAGLAAMLSKEHAAVFPAALLGWDLLYTRRAGRPLRDVVRRRWLRPGGPLLALAIAVGVYLALRWIALGTLAGPSRISPVDNPLADVGSVTRWAGAAIVLARYLGLLLAPVRLSADYSFAAIRPVASPLDPAVLGALAALVLTGAVLVLAARREAGAGVLALLLALPFVVTSNVLFPIGTIMAERLLYLPSVGACLLLALGGWRLLARAGPRTARVALLVALALASARTVARNRDWRDSLALFTSAVRVVPRSVKVQTNLGVALLRAGRGDEALRAFDAAIAIDPTYDAARINLAALLVERGDRGSAETQLRAVLAAQPEHRLARVELAELLRIAGDLVPAELVLREGLRYAPDAAELHARLGAVLAARGRAQDAEHELREALRLEPDSAAASNDLALLLQRSERVEEAIELLRHAVSLAADSVPTRNNLGNALREAGRLDESVAELQRALELRPDFAPTLHNLGLTLERAGRFDEARQHFERALALRPDDAGSRRALARLAVRARDPSEALRQIDEALALDESSAESWALRARIHLAISDGEQAESDYRRALELEPQSVVARNGLAIVLALRGEREAARALWEEALELAPDSEEIRENLRKLDRPGD